MTVLCQWRIFKIPTSFISLFLRAAARNVEYLGLLGVTHVLNTAEGAGAAARMAVNTSQEYYSPSGNVGTTHGV